MGYDIRWTKDHSDEGYFRANIWYMQFLRKLMIDVGILDTVTPEPVWPRPGKPWDELTKEEQEEYEEQANVIRASRSPFVNQIPIWKFGSNDAWLITPHESGLIADVLGAKIKETLEGVEDKLKMGRFLVNKDAKTKLEEMIGDLKFAQSWCDYCAKCRDADVSFEVC